MADMKEDLKKMMREVLKETMEEAQSSGYPSEVPLAKAKQVSKKKTPKTVFDETRKQGPDSRDPRLSKEAWPCKGAHVSEFGNNRFGKWEQRATCAVRLSYTPAVDAPAQATHTDLPQNITEALHRLRTEGFEANDLTARQVKAMVTIVAKEKILQKRTDPEAKKKSDKRQPEIMDMTKEDSDPEFAVVGSPGK